MFDPLRVCLERIIELNELQADVKHIDEAIQIAKQVLEGYDPHVVVILTPDDTGSDIFGLFANEKEAEDWALRSPLLIKTVTDIEDP